jgi:hypothetical protein
LSLILSILAKRRYNRSQEMQPMSESPQIALLCEISAISVLQTQRREA